MRNGGSKDYGKRIKGASKDFSLICNEGVSLLGEEEIKGSS